MSEFPNTQVSDLTPEQVQGATFIKRNGVVLKSRYGGDVMPFSDNATLYPHDHARFAW